jgi:uncharacterized protein (UPF0276 family)
MGGISTLLEWDADIPDFEVVHAEALLAKRHRESADRQATEVAEAYEAVV